MLYLVLKAALSGLLIATASEAAKRSPGLGALITALPLVSVLAMIWFWRDTHDPARLGAYVGATFWYVLPSLPMFLVIPELLKRGVPFWTALAAGCGVTIALYLAITALGPRLGLKL